MFSHLKNLVFWTSDFDRLWEQNAIFLKSAHVDYEWSKRIEEKKYYWRAQGKLRRLSPTDAVFRGFEDISSALHRERRDRADMHSVWLELAYALYHAAPPKFEERYVPPEETLPPLWRAYYEEYRNRDKEEKAKRQQRFDEVVSHRFPQDEIDRALRSLRAGTAPNDAQRIWQAAGPARASAHHIAGRAGVTIRDFVFWMVVLRQCGMMNESIVNDEHLYCRDGTWPPTIK